MGTHYCSSESCDRQVYARYLCKMHYMRWFRNPSKINTTTMTFFGTDEQRFWHFVKKSDECWEWASSATRNGYGVLHLNNRKIVPAHRFGFELQSGEPIPDGMYVCHRCDNRRCVRYSHLFLGTHAENMDDMRAKGRAHKGRSTRLSDAEVEEIRKQHANGSKQRQLAEKYGVQPNTISRIVNFKRRIPNLTSNVRSQIREGR